MPRLFVGPATPVAGADKEFRIWLNYRRWRNFEFSRLNLRLPADVSAAGFWLMASFVVRAVVRIDSAAINPRKAIAAATPTIAKIGTEPLRRMVSSVFRRSPQARLAAFRVCASILLALLQVGGALLFNLGGDRH
jgi:hypothetical protein